MLPPVFPAPAPVKLAEYWMDPALNLKRGSIDEKYAKAHKQKATVPGNYVSDLQKDLIRLGYLKAGSDDGSYAGGTERAVRRFQRHARRSFRVQGDFKIVSAPWVGMVTGVCDQNTAEEVRDWINSGYTLPLYIYEIVPIEGAGGHHLREDVLELWEKAVADVESQGGIIVPPGVTGKDTYSDTWRNPANPYKSSGGNSPYSLHYTGRAVDLNESLAGGKGQRWWIVKETVGGDIYWRLYCKTERQDGTQGTKIEKQSTKYFEFYKHEGEKWIPAGYYIDMTDILERNKFVRIRAHADWYSNDKGREWWHFHYAEDLQETFQDEVELIGYNGKEYTEDVLLHSGRTLPNLDHGPG